jgi:hypothetical protein
MHRAPGWIAVVCLALIAPSARTDAARGGNVCDQSAEVLRNACENEARDDAWVVAAVCLNLPDPAETRTCRADAKTARREAQSDCHDQFDARRDLCEALGQAPYAPAIAPARFLSPAATAAAPNPFLPLVPGRTLHYASPSEIGTVEITHRTRTILGVTCIVVRDLVVDNGLPVEDTDDYFAQDVDGNVWYFGELSQNFEDGVLTDLDGSWLAGVDGAQPGIVMPAAPTVGTTYRQEFAPGDAEDAATVVSVTASESAPGASCTGTCLQTLDFTPIEPDAREHKFYAPGVGMIVTVNLENGERTELVGVATE